MDVALLISSVFKRPAIWDRQNKFYADKLQVYKCWSEISKELQLDESLLRKKWKYLRDQFAVELGKFPLSDSSSGDGADGCTSKWQYFKQLAFLKNFVKPRFSFSTGNSFNHPFRSELDPNAMTFTVENNEQSQHSEQSQPTETVYIKEEACSSNSFANQTISNNSGSSEDISELPIKILRTSKSRHTTKSATSNHTFDFEDKRRKSNNSTENVDRKNDENQDDDLMFLKSLLPYIRQIPRQRRLRFRSKLLDLVEGFIPLPTSPSSSSFYQHQQQQQLMYSPHEPCGYGSDTASESSVVEPQKYPDENNSEPTW